MRPNSAELMATLPRRRPRWLRPGWPPLLFLLLVLLLAGGGCGGDGGTEPKNDELSALVGDWRARRFVVTNKSNPEQAPDLIGDLNASFSINIQPSGLYTAILVYQGTPLTELGTLEIDGNEVVFHVETGQPRTNRSAYALVGSVLTLVGDTEFDYDFDGASEMAVATIELVRQ